MRMRRAALAAVIAAAGLWIYAPASGEAFAAGAKSTVDKPVKLSKFTKRQAQAGKKSRSARSQHTRRTASKTPSKTVAQTDRSKPATKSAATSETDKSSQRPPLDKVSHNDLPPSVANARAEAFARDEAQNLAALDDDDVTVKKDGVQIAQSDQLNETDRALTPEQATEQATPEAPAAATLPAAPATKVIKAVPATGERQAVKTGDSDPWSKTSLIGKIFVAFGSLLTLASAARLFIA